MLRQVYFDEPDGSRAESPWFQIRGPSGTGGPLALVNDDSRCWRGIYASDLWVDDNHVAPGVGYVGIMMAAFSGAHGSALYDVIGDQPYNLHGARLSCEVRAPSSGPGLRLGKHVRILFWIQFRDLRANVGAGCYVNIGYIGRSIDHVLGFTAPFERKAQETVATDWLPFDVTFDVTRPEDWVMYGASVKRSDTYGYPNSLRQLFERWDWNMGFHAVYGHNKPTTGDLPCGHFDVRRMQLSVDATVNGLAGEPRAAGHPGPGAPQR
jgi:hypothetical protein